MEGEKPGKRRDKVCHRSHEGGDRHPDLRIFEIARIDRNGLCPAKTDKEHRESADRINMAERIKRESAALLYPLVAE